MKDDDALPLAVNGTLMRGLELNPNLLEVGATFLYESCTAPKYRLWSIGDVHPGMVRVDDDDEGASIALEVWSVPASGIARVLQNEPPGLCIGKVILVGGDVVLGVLAEPALCRGEREITSYCGWRAYRRALEEGQQK
ncbi:hypothetical protein ACHAXA_002715 [Cyclostephanos tholiformis]|jgi:hypothetical protein|uniref:Allophanate hydrolase C-terminal domain-containing protein n=1 Tax=Cyclostephanos tholiformis TaxID=382380 RepID=A0ABD3R3Q1_9STRA